MKTVVAKVVLVTGAAMGMGRMYAERAVAERAKAVVLWDVDETTLTRRHSWSCSRFGPVMFASPPTSRPPGLVRQAC